MFLISVLLSHPLDGVEKHFVSVQPSDLHSEHAAASWVATVLHMMLIFVTLINYRLLHGVLEVVEAVLS